MADEGHDMAITAKPSHLVTDEIQGYRKERQETKRLFIQSTVTKNIESSHRVTTRRLPVISSINTDSCSPHTLSANQIRRQCVRKHNQGESNPPTVYARWGQRKITQNAKRRTRNRSLITGHLDKEPYSHP